MVKVESHELESRGSRHLGLFSVCCWRFNEYNHFEQQSGLHQALSSLQNFEKASQGKLPGYA